MKQVITLFYRRTESYISCKYSAHELKTQKKNDILYVISCNVRNQG